ncbi:FMN-binding protein [Xylanimonas sp. McL0601]|uniref:FMN-binding protein n=1 Tax=Xylanimonas sp. McL0601 TaxID=3414739 RepID=UPI003CF6C08D
MKRIATWVFATVGGIVLLFSYKTSTEVVSATSLPPTPTAQAGNAQTTPPPAQGSPSPTPTQQKSPAGTPAQPAPVNTPAQPASGLKDGTYTGTRQDTPYGPVRVSVTISGGKVTAATATDYPNTSRRDLAINNYAIPQLQSESAGTTNGQIDMVSGATYTSNGYIGSLQDAIDQAR